MQYSFLASIDNLRIDRPIGNGWQVAGPLRITNSTTVAQRVVNDFFQGQVGELEARTFLSGKPFVYAIAEYPLQDDSPDGQLELLDRYLVILQIFFNVLWLFKDNALNFSLGFVQYPYFYPTPPGRRIRVSSNGRGLYFTTADGNSNEVVFTVEELKTAIGLSKTLFDPMENILLLDSLPGLVQAATADRASRAFYFLQAARSAASLPQKIANYCTCFEALVSTDPAELSHKVSERVAVILNSPSIDSEVVYQDIKAAYSTRSRLVHGSMLPPDPVRYRTQSINCDSYLRMLLHRLIDDPDLKDALEQSPQELDAYLLHRLFHNRDLG